MSYYLRHYSLFSSEIPSLVKKFLDATDSIDELVSGNVLFIVKGISHKSFVDCN